MYITAQGCRLRNDLYCVEWDVKLYYTIPYLTLCHDTVRTVKSTTEHINCLFTSVENVVVTLAFSSTTFVSLFAVHDALNLCQSRFISEA